jgi:hypothetical protein
LSSDDEDTQSGRPDVTSDQNGPAADDTGDKGTTSAETLVPGPIGTDVPGKPKLSVTDRASVKPPADVAERSKVSRQSPLAPWQCLLWLLLLLHPLQQLLSKGEWA